MAGRASEAASGEAGAGKAGTILLILLTTGSWLFFLTCRAPGTDAALRGFPLDDGWIHMVYARSLATEGGFHYNAGVSEAGMTSPLWVVLLAGVHAIVGKGEGAGVDPGAAARVVLGAKVLSLAFGVAGVLALRGLARDLGEGEGAAVLAGAIAALDPSLTFARAAGMEVPLFIFLVLAALRDALAGRPIRAGALAGLSIVARPEGIVLLPIYGALLWRGRALVSAAAARARSGPTGSLPARSGPTAAAPHGRDLALAALLAVLPALAYSAFCLSAVGAPLPNTFYAKFQAQSPLSLDIVSFGWRNYVRDNLPYFTLEAGGLLALLGTIRLARRRGLAGLAPAAAGAALFVSALASRAYSPGHFFYWERWLIPAFPFLLLGIASGIGEIAAGCPSLRPAGPRARGGKSGARGPRPAAGPAAREAAPREGTAHRTTPRFGVAPAWRAAALAALALAAWRVPPALAERAKVFAWNAQNIEEMNVALGRWVDETLPREAVVAVNDAGAIRYFGRRTTIDLLGLNDHKILRRDPAQGIQPLLDRHVGYLIVFPSWFPGLEQSLPVRPVHQVRSPHYTICEGPQDLMVVYQLEKP